MVNCYSHSNQQQVNRNGQFARINLADYPA
jgi:hypothetical protein